MRHTPDVREKARYAHSIQRGRGGVEATPRANRTYAPQIISPRPVPYYNSNAPITGSSSGRSMVPQQSYQSDFPSNPDPFDPGHSGMRPPPAPTPPTYAQDYYNSGRPYSPNPTISARTDSPAESYYSNPSLKCSRTSLSSSHSLSQRSSMVDISHNIQWNTDLQTKFETAIGRLTASASFPLNWVTNPEFITFCQDFIVGAKVPSRKVLTQWIIPGILKQVCAIIKLLY